MKTGSHTDAIPIPFGRARTYEVPHVLVRMGRAMGKSTTLAIPGLIASQLLGITNWRDPSDWHKNLVLREWAAIGALLLSSGLSKYRISTMYLEFVNVASPGTQTAPPAYDRNAASGVAYYNGLITSSNTDYLRVPVIAAPVDTTDQTLYPKGNLVTFFAQTAGTVGVHGKPFGDTHNSTIVGGALVAAVDQADATEDLVLSRLYFPQGQQPPKLPTGNVGVEWEIQLG